MKFWSKALKRLHADERGAIGLEHLRIMAAIVLPLLGALLYFRKEITEWVKTLWDRIRSDAEPDLMP